MADMCRFNCLSAVKKAGSGHLGSSFSAMDIVVFLLYEHLNSARVGFDDPDRDVYFSSKGHDVPGLYAVLNSLGIVPTEKLLRLRRSGGLDGHPNVRAPGIEANSGSLGMGISKGRGIAWAKRQLGRGGRVVVMVGDGELQEGQNFEALQGAAHDRLTADKGLHPFVFGLDPLHAVLIDEAPFPFTPEGQHVQVRGLVILHELFDERVIREILQEPCDVTHAEIT